MKAFLIVVTILLLAVSLFAWAVRDFQAIVFFGIASVVMATLANNTSWR